MIKAVIFDCFGVLTTDGWRQIREEFLMDDEAKLQEAHDIDRAVNAGKMSHNEFIEGIVALSGLSRGEVLARINGNQSNAKLFEYIRDVLKPSYKIGMLSNAADDWLDELFAPWQAELFDQVILSYQLGTVKPDPVIYETATARLGVLPEESIFIDDQERYCIAAERLGMKAIVHTDTKTTIAHVEELIRA